MVTSLIPEGVVQNVRRTCAEVVAAAEAHDRPVRNVWGYASWPDHNSRRCVDYMVTTQARGDWVAGYVWDHRKRLGLRLIIWNRRIRRTYRKGLIPAGVWSRYTGSSPHTDHVHTEQDEKPYEPPLRRAQGLWLVDPAKVTTGLVEVGRDGRGVRERNPGFLIRNGSHLVHQGGREWLVTTKGTRYAREYLRRP